MSRPAAALIAALIGVGGCSSPAAPSSNSPAPPATTRPTTEPSASPSPAPSGTPAIVKVTPIPDAPDSKTVVKVTALHVRWIPTTLTAPAGMVWHVEVDNQDGPPEHHNFVVASGKTVQERIFQSPNFDMGTFTFDVPALPVGSYLFICTIHPDVMTGTLTLD